MIELVEITRELTAQEVKRAGAQAVATLHHAKQVVRLLNGWARADAFSALASAFSGYAGAPTVYARYYEWRVYQLILKEVLQ